MTQLENGFTIPKKEWWCGCIPTKRFRTEKQFRNHLFRTHTSSYDSILKDIEERNS